jgi:hypothetical protein
MRFCAAVTGVLAAFLCGAPAAFGQTQSGPARPYRALFGGAGNDVSARQSVGLSISLVESYDGNVAADLVGGFTPSLFQVSGFYTGLVPQVNFQRRGKRVQVVAAAGSSLRYYGDLHQVVAVNHSVSAGFSAQLGGRTTLSMSQAASYSPSFLNGLFANVARPGAGDVIAPAADYMANSERSYTYSTTASLVQGIARRGSLAFNSAYRDIEFVGDVSGFSNLRSYDVGGTFLYGLNRDVTLRLGYTYRQAAYAQTLRPTEHDIDVGIDYQLSLSRTRRTTLAFATGSTVVSGPLLPGGPIRKQYRISGNALLTHQIGRTWRVQGVYRRGAGFIEGITGPVFTDAWTVTADGFLNRRTDVLTSAAYSTGDAALAGSSSNFTTYTSNVRVRFAVTRMWATYAEYLYYFYDLSRLQVSAGLSPGLRRTGVRVGLTLWIPVRRR